MMMEMMEAMLTMMKMKKMCLRVCASVSVCVCLCICACIPPGLVNIKLKYFCFCIRNCFRRPSNVGKPKLSEMCFPNGPQHNNIGGGVINKCFETTSTCFSLILSRVVGYNSEVTKTNATEMLFAVDDSSHKG